MEITTKKRFLLVLTSDYNEDYAQVMDFDREELPDAGIGEEVGDFDYLTIGSIAFVGHYTSKDSILIRVN